MEIILDIFCVDFSPRPSLAPDSFDQRLKSVHRLDKPVAGFLVRIFQRVFNFTPIPAEMI